MSDILIDNPLFYNILYNFMHYFKWITRIVTLLFIIGVLTDKPSSFLFFNFLIKILLAVFLLYRFNSYRKSKIVFTELDRKICYSAGMYIIIFSFLDVIQVYITELRNMIDPYTIPIINKVKYIFTL
jgi:hypothetical protein